MCFNPVTEGPKPVSKERASAISDAIMNVISLDLRPFNSVAGRGFKYLLYVLKPGYIVHHGTKFSRTLLSDHYHAVKELIKKQLKTAKHVSIALDL